MKFGDIEAIDQLMDLGGGENVNDLALGARELEFCGDIRGKIFVLIEPMEEGTESSDIGLDRDLGKIAFLQSQQIPFARDQRDVFHLFHARIALKICQTADVVPFGRRAIVAEFTVDQKLL